MAACSAESRHESVSWPLRHYRAQQTRAQCRDGLARWWLPLRHSLQLLTAVGMPRGSLAARVARAISSLVARHHRKCSLCSHLACASHPSPRAAFAVA
eukprot:2968009-Pyramimonas_sp.AAC.1